MLGLTLSPCHICLQPTQAHCRRKRDDQEYEANHGVGFKVAIRFGTQRVGGVHEFRDTNGGEQWRILENSHQVIAPCPAVRSARLGAVRRGDRYSWSKSSAHDRLPIAILARPPAPRDRPRTDRFRNATRSSPSRMSRPTIRYRTADHKKYEKQLHEERCGPDKLDHLPNRHIDQFVGVSVAPASAANRRRQRSRSRYRLPAAYCL